MGNLLRRVLAFVLGIVFTLAAAGGALVGGAYWAYKNVKPVAIVTDEDDGFGELRDQSIEDLVNLLSAALEQPDKYTFARLEAEYGIDFEAVLKKAGIEGIDKDSKNWEALMGISLFTIKDDMKNLLGDIKVRALYNFIPSLAKKDLDQILSKEAQEKLGDYSIMDLISTDEVTNEIGILKAIKTLKLGSLMPEYFKGVYDDVNHEYTYVLNTENEKVEKLPVLDIFGNVSFGIIQNMISGNDFMNEFLDGGLSSVAKMPVADIIHNIVATFAPDVATTIDQYTKALNGASVSDLFVPNDKGGYDFYYMGVLSEIQTGYLLGLTDEDKDGVWVDKDGKPAEDLIQVAANLNFGAIVENKDAFGMIRDLIGDLNIGMIFDVAGLEEGKIPALDALRGLEVGKILEGQSGSFDVNVFLKAIISNLQESFGDVTLGELINIGSTGNAIVDGLFELRLSDLLMEEYTLDKIVEAFRNALGDVSIGTILGYEKDSETGNWICENEIIALILDFSFDNIFDMLESDYTLPEVIETLLPDTTMGDIVCAIFGFEYDTEKDQYFKLGAKSGKQRYISVNFSSLLKMKLCDIVSGLTDPDSPIDVYTELDKVRMGDLANLLNAYFDLEFEDLAYNEETGKYIWAGKADGTSRALNLTIAKFIEDAMNGFNTLLTEDIDTYIDLVGAVINVVVEATNVQKYAPKDMVNDIVDLLKDLFNGNFKELIIDGNLKIGKVVSLVGNIVKSYVKDVPVIDVVFDNVAEIYKNTTVQSFVEDSKNIKIADLVSFVNEVVVTLVPDYKELADSLCNLVNEFIGGTVTDVVIKVDAYVSDVIKEAKTIVNSFIKDNADVNFAFDELINFFEGVRLNTFVDDIKGVKIDKAIDLVTGILGRFVKEPVGLVDNLNKLLKDLLSGTILDVKFESTLNVGAFITDVRHTIDLIKEIPELQTILDELAKLYKDVTVGNFVDGTMNLDVDDVITTVNVITDTFAKGNKELDNIYDKLHILLSGKLNNLEIHGEEFWNSLNDNEKLIVGIAGGTIVVVGGTILYFVNNDMLIDVVTQVMGEDCALGTLIAEPVGYEDVNGVYKNNGVENALATQVFAITLQELLKTGFKFSDHVEADVVTIENIGIIGKAAYGKYGTDEYINGIVNASLDMIINLYDDVKVVDIADGTMKIGLDNLAHNLANVVRAITKDDIDVVVDHVENIVKMVFAGTIGEPKYHSKLLISDVLNEVQLIVNHFNKKGEDDLVFKVVNTAFDEIEKLYAGVTVKTFVKDSKNLKIDNVIIALSNIAKEAVNPDLDVTIDGVTKLLTDVLCEKVSAPKIEANLLISQVVDDVEAIVFNYTRHPALRTAFEEISTLYNNVKVVDFVEGSKKLYVKDTLTAVGNIVKKVIPAEYAGVVDGSVDLVLQFIGGTLGNIKVLKDAYVSEILTGIRDIVNGVKKIDEVNYVIDELITFFDGVRLNTFVDDIKGIKVDKAVDLVTNITGKFVKKPEGIVDNVNKILKDLLAGTILDVKFESTLNVGKLATDVRNTIDLIKEIPEIQAVLDEFANLYKDITVGNFVEGTKAIEVDALVHSIAEVMRKIIPDDKWDRFVTHAENITKMIVGGTLGTPGYHSDVKIADIVNEVQTLVNHFAGTNSSDAIKAVNVGFDQIEKLYGDTTIKNFVEGSKAIKIDGVIVMVGEIVKVFTNDVYDHVTDDSVKLLTDLIAGDFTKAGIEESTTIALVINDVKAIGERLSFPVEIDVIYDELIRLYGETLVIDIVPATKDLRIDDVVIALSNITKEFVNPDIDLTIDAVAKLLTDVLCEKISAPKIEADLLVSTLLDDVKAIIFNYRKPPVLEKAFAEISALYNNVKVVDFVEGSKNLLIKDTLIAVGNIVKEAVPSEYAGAINGSINLVLQFIGGTLGNPEVIKDAYVSDVLTQIKTIVMSVKRVDEVGLVFDQVINFFDGVKISTFVEDMKAVKLDKAIVTAGEIVKVFTNDAYDHVADDSVKLLTDLLAGTIVNPGIESTITIEEIVCDARPIADVVGHESIYVALDSIDQLYKGVKVKDVVTATKSLRVDHVVEATSAVVKTFFNDVTDDLIDDVTKLVTDIIAGTFTKFGIDGDRTISVIAEDVKLVLDNFDEIRKVEAVTVTLDVIKELYKDVKIVDFVDASKHLKVDNVVLGTAEIAKAFFNDATDDLIDDIAKAVTDVIAGDFVKFGINGDLLVSTVLTDVKDIVDNFNDKIDVINVSVAELSKLYGGVKVLDFVDGTMNLDVDNVITAVNAITDTFASDVPAIQKTYDKLHILLSGKLNNLTFNGEEFWNSLNDNEKLIVALVGGTVVGGVGTVLYFANNPMLIDLVTKAFGENKTIGSLVAEHMGYEDVNGVYMNNGEENALATQVFALTLQEVLTTGFKFSDHIAEELVTIENFGIIGKATYGKYGKDEYINGIVNASFDMIINLYDDVKVKDIKQGTMDIVIEELVNGVSDVAKAAIPDDKLDRLVAHVANLTNMVIGGTIAEPGYHSKLLVADLINQVQTIANHFIGTKTNDAIKAMNIFFDEVEKLYGNTTIKNFVEGTKAIKIDGVIKMAGEIVKAFANDFYDHITDDTVKLLTDLLAGTIVNPGVESSVTVSEIVRDAQVVAERFTGHGIVGVTANEVCKLYGTTPVKQVVEVTKHLKLDDLVVSAGNISKVFTDDKADELIDNAVILLTDIFAGELTKGGIDSSLKVENVVTGVENTVGVYYKNDLTKVAFNSLRTLYKDALVKDIANATRNISVDDLINSASNVVKVVVNDERRNELITLAEEFVCMFVGGTLANPGVVSNVKIVKAVDQAILIADWFDFKGKTLVIDFASAVKGLYSDSAEIRNFATETKNISLKAGVNAVKQTLASIDGLNDKLARAYELAEVFVDGTIGAPQFHFNEMWNMASKKEKLVIAGVGAGAGLFLYVAANDVLVNIVEKTVGADKTWYELVGEKLGYTFDGTNYVTAKDGLVNSLMNAVLGEKVVITVAKGYDIKGTIRDHLTVGNLLTAWDTVRDKFEQVVPGASVITKTPGGKWTMNNGLESLFQVVLNIDLVDVYHNRTNLKGYVVELFGDLKIADVGFGYVVNKLGSKSTALEMKAERNADGTWTFTGRFSKLLSEVLNISLVEVKDTLKGGTTGVKNLISDITSKLTLGDVIGEAIIVMDTKANNDGKPGERFNLSFDETTNKWVATGKYSHIVATLSNLNMKEFITNIRKDAKGYLGSNEVLGSVRIGELLGNGCNVYDEVTGKWTNKGAIVVFKDGIEGEILKKVYGFTLYEIINQKVDVKALMNGIYIGDFMKYTCDKASEEGHVHTDDCKWFADKEVYILVGEGAGATETERKTIKVEVEPMNAKLASISMTSLIDGGLDIMGTIGKLTLGELMGYAVVVDGENKSFFEYRKKDGLYSVTVDANGLGHLVADTTKAIEPLAGAVADMAIEDLLKSDGIKNVMNKIEALELGHILGFTMVETIDGEGNKVVTWYKDAEKTTKVEGLLGKLSGYTLAYVKDHFSEIINDFTIGEIITVDESSTQILKLLKDTKISELSTRVDSMYVGEIMGYTCDSDGVAGHVHDGLCKWYKEDTVYIAELVGDQYVATGTKAKHKVELDPINNALAGISVNDLRIMNINKILKDFTLGQFMNYVKGSDNKYYGYLEYIDGTNSFKAYAIDSATQLGSLVADKDKPASELVSAVADIKLVDMMENGGIDKVMDKVKALKIGHILGYTAVKDASDVIIGWENAGVPVTGLMGKLSGYTLNEVENDFETIVKDFEINEIITINETSPQILKALNGTTIGGLSDKINTLKLGDVITIDETSHVMLKSLKDTKVNDLGAKVTTLTLGEVMVIDGTSPTILQLLKTSKIDELGTSIEGLTIGEIMGYKKSGATWYKDADNDNTVDPGEEITNDIELVLADYTMAKIMAGGLGTDLVDDITNKVHIGTFFNSGAGGVFSLFTQEELNGITLGNFATKVTEKMNPATMKVDDLNKLGVLDGTMFTEAGTQRGLALMLGCYGNPTEPGSILAAKNAPIDEVRAKVGEKTVKELFDGLFSKIVLPTT